MPISNRARLSRFGDDRWDMTPGIFQTRARSFSRELDFTGIDCPVERLTEYIYASLNERLSDGRSRLRPSATVIAQRDLRRFMNFVCDRLGTFDAGMIDQELIDAYRSLLVTGTAAASQQIAK